MECDFPINHALFLSVIGISVKDGICKFAAQGLD